MFIRSSETICAIKLANARILCFVMYSLRQQFEYKVPAAGQKRSERRFVSLNGMARYKIKKLIWAHVSHYPF